MEGFNFFKNYEKKMKRFQYFIKICRNFLNKILKMKRQDNGNEHLNSIRNEFNGRVEMKSYLGRTKRIAWSGNRRYRTI